MFRKLSEIRPDPAQPRKIFDPKHIRGLAKSLEQEGIINPIEIDETGMIVTGECRFRAATFLGWEQVPVQINRTELGDYERLRRQMAENVHQSGADKDSMMNPIDTARGYKKLLDMRKFRAGRNQRKRGHNSGINELAREIGVDDSTIAAYIDLLSEPAYVLHAVEKGLPRTYLVEASRAPKALQDKIKRKAAKGEYNSRDELIQEVRIAQRIPDLALIELERKRLKESFKTNRILNQIARLALALEDIKFSKVDVREQGIIRKQLEWLETTIISYLNPQNN